MSKNGTPIQPRILVVVLTMHERMGWVCNRLAQWIAELNFHSYGFQFQVGFAHNFIPAAAARNYIGRHVTKAKPRPDWLMMIDNDMAPPPNVFETVKDAPKDASIVVPQFAMWDESKPSVTLCWGMDEKIAPPQDTYQLFTLEPGKFYPLSKAGTGCIFIKPEVFEIISMPYFWYTYNNDQGMEATEDINFSKKVIAAGLKIYGNTSIRVGHYHNVNLDRLADYVYKKYEVESPSTEKEAAACPA